LEFPCEESTLYDHWNPLNVDPASSPRTYHGTPDQYEMGDLSGKFGNLDNQTLYKVYYNDTMLPLFGPRSILGRSIIIHKTVNDPGVSGNLVIFKFRTRCGGRVRPSREGTVRQKPES
jgi:hypothetical protein